jgi:protein SCO1/2
VARRPARRARARALRARSARRRQPRTLAAARLPQRPRVARAQLRRGARALSRALATRPPRGNAGRRARLSRRRCLAAGLLALASACGDSREAEPGLVGRSGSFAEPEPEEARDPAPQFALTDQEGRPFRSESLRGRAAVVDFIFTSCGGPCPIQTGIHAALQRRLPPELRARVAFVSISVDPEHDTPERLRDYARARGADLSDWSFLTGPRAEIDAVARGFGIGATRAPDGELLHTTATLLLDPEGRIARRLTGVEHGPAELEAALRELL